MSANPQNAGLELVQDTRRSPASTRQPNLVSMEDPRRRDALQSLLAFATLRQQALERRRQDGGSNGTGTRIKREPDSFALDEVLQLVAERALAITGADGIAIALAENDAIICRASSGSVAPDAGARVNLSSGFSGECLVSGQVIRCDDAENDPRVDAAACRCLGASSMLAVPLSAKNTVIGLIEAFSSEPCGFNDCDVRSLDLLAELILAALRPEDEDRLAETSRNVVAKAFVDTVWPEILAASVPATPSDLEVAKGGPKETEAALEVSEAAPLELAGYAADERTRPGLLVVVAVLGLAIALGGGLLWVIRHKSQFYTKVGARAVDVQAPGSGTSPFGTATGASLETGGEDETSDVEPPANPGEMTAVTGIRHWSAGDSSTVVIDLENQVQYEAHRLSSPERIYFDLHGTKLAGGLPTRPIDVQDALLQRIRVAQSAKGITRVVLETNGSPDFSVSLQQDPYRLVVELQKPGSKPRDRARTDLFAPANVVPANTALLPPQPAASSRAGSDAAGAALATSPRLSIALDAGHGGWDLGTAGKTGLLEKDLVLDIVARLGQLIVSRMGATVIYTRQNDDYVALERRAEIANLAHADLFLSVHANHSGSASARGAETYYSNTYSSLKARDLHDGDATLKSINWTNVDIRAKVHESHRLAVSVQHALYGVLAAGNPGLPNRGVKEAEYVVLAGASMPAVLAEVSFVSSPADEGNLRNAAYRQQIAEALYQGIAHYAKDTVRVNMADSAAKSALR